MAVAAGTTFVQVVAMRSSDSYELQRSVWDAVLFLGLEAFHWHEQLFLILAYLIIFILQLVFCLMVVHLGLDFAAMDDDSLTGLEVWLKEAEAWQISAVCGPSIDYSSPAATCRWNSWRRPGGTSRRQSLDFLGARSSLAWSSRCGLGRW